jgi:hypothetical protein
MKRTPRSESPCGHYMGLKRAHCYKCLHEDRRSPDPNWDNFVEMINQAARKRGQA